MNIQIEISADPSFLGDAATIADVDTLASNARDAVRTAYPDAAVSSRVVSTSKAFRVILHGEGPEAGREGERDAIEALVQDAYSVFA